MPGMGLDILGGFMSVGPADRGLILGKKRRDVKTIGLISNEMSRIMT